MGLLRGSQLLEIIPFQDTLPEVVDFISHFGEHRLDKGIVLCKDTPNFVANRVFSVCHTFIKNYILEHGYTVFESDSITGPLIGRPKTATFRLMDLVGIDVSQNVSSNLAKAIPHDEIAQKVLNLERSKKLTAAMIERGWLGKKTGQGYYKTVRKNGEKEFWVLNLETLEYEPPGEKLRFDSVEKVEDIEDLGTRLKALLAEEDRAARLVQTIMYFTLSYASQCLPEITELPSAIDNASRWGFMHQAGPFEIWDSLGVAETTERMKAADYSPAKWVDELLAAGFETFYQYEDDIKVAVYNPTKETYSSPVQ